MRYQGKHEKKRYRWGRFLLRLFGAILAVILLAYPFVEARMLRVDTHSIESGDLSANVGQLRIVYVSDIHEGSFWSHSRTVNLIRKVNALNGDLVLLGGDYATDPESAIAFFEEMPNLHSTYGTFAVLGDTDRIEDRKLKELTVAMKNHGITPLVNEVRSVRIGTQDIYVAGVDDITAGADVQAVASQVSASDFTVLMAHNPALMQDALRATDRQGKINWFDLGLSGHTHGGQIALLGSALGIADGDTRYGWTVTNRINMLISPGVGTTKLPIRIGRPPQIHVVVVKGTGQEAR